MDLEQYFANIDRNTLERYCVSALRRVIAHYALWFRETIHQMGEEEAFRIEEEVWSGVWDNHLKRLGKTIGFQVTDGIPDWLKSLKTEQLKGLVDALAANWLAQDGIWFQALERSASNVGSQIGQRHLLGTLLARRGQGSQEVARAPRGGRPRGT